jgi:transcriptional regulator with XRE-family HTH domain
LGGNAGRRRLLMDGRAIRAARLLRGWRRKDLVAAAGVHPDTVALYEQRAHIGTPMPPAAAKIVAALGEEAIRQGLDLARPVTIVQRAGIIQGAPAARVGARVKGSRRRPACGAATEPTG